MVPRDTVLPLFFQKLLMAKRTELAARPIHRTDLPKHKYVNVRQDIIFLSSITTWIHVRKCHTGCILRWTKDPIFSAAVVQFRLSGWFLRLIVYGWTWILWVQELNKKISCLIATYLYFIKCVLFVGGGVSSVSLGFSSLKKRSITP